MVAEKPSKKGKVVAHVYTVCFYVATLRTKIIMNVDLKRVLLPCSVAKNNLQLEFAAR